MNFKFIALTFLLASNLLLANTPDNQPIQEKGVLEKFFKQRGKDFAVGCVAARAYLPAIMIGNKACGDQALLGLPGVGSTPMGALMNTLPAAITFGGLGGLAVMPVLRFAENITEELKLNTDILLGSLGAIGGKLYHDGMYESYRSSMGGQASKLRHGWVSVILPAVILPLIHQASRAVEL